MAQAKPGPIRYMTVGEVAGSWRISKMSVYRLIHSGELRAIRIGRSFRVAEGDFEAFETSAFVAVKS